MTTAGWFVVTVFVCYIVAVGFGILMMLLTFVAAELGGVLEVNNKALYYL